MKNILQLIIAALLTLFVACKKESKPVSTGISAKKENLDWKAEVANTYNGYKPEGTKDTLVVVGNTGQETITIFIAQKGKGTYTGNQIRALFYQPAGFDIPASPYLLANTPANKVIITEYDEQNSVLKGSFNLVFKKNEGINLPNTFPDTIRFTNGQINMKFTGFPAMPQ